MRLSIFNILVLTLATSPLVRAQNITDGAKTINDWEGKPLLQQIQNESDSYWYVDLNGESFYVGDINAPGELYLFDAHRFKIIKELKGDGNILFNSYMRRGIERLVGDIGCFTSGPIQALVLFDANLVIQEVRIMKTASVDYKLGDYQLGELTKQVLQESSGNWFLRKGVGNKDKYVMTISYSL